MGRFYAHQIFKKHFKTKQDAEKFSIWAWGWSQYYTKVYFQDDEYFFKFIDLHSDEVSFDLTDDSESHILKMKIAFLEQSLLPPKVKICSECNLNPLKYHNGLYNKRCLSCSNKRAKNNKNHLVKKKKNLTKKKCKNCKKTFLTSNPLRKYCHNPCENIVINQADVWINKKPRKQCNSMDGQAVAYSFFRKKYSPSKIFSVCRG